MRKPGESLTKARARAKSRAIRDNETVDVVRVDDRYYAMSEIDKCCYRAKVEVIETYKSE